VSPDAKQAALFVACGLGLVVVVALASWALFWSGASLAI
jgi:hypothetical protein